MSAKADAQNQKLLEAMIKQIPDKGLECDFTSHDIWLQMLTRFYQLAKDLRRDELHPRSCS
jgi:hypothetical protein